MPPILPCAGASPAPTCTRSQRLADRLEAGAQALIEFARPLTDEQWRTAVPHDGRTVGIVVHHVASVYPIEIELARLVASGTPIVNVTSSTIDEMNAGHAAKFANVSRSDALALLVENSTAAAAAIRALKDEELDTATTVSLYGNALLTSQFVLEDHAVRHSAHHLARLRATLQIPESTATAT